jgi:predicted transcriptional regulator
MNNAGRMIRIDEEVREFLQRHAEPLTDTPNSVLRRLLGLPPAETRTSISTNKLIAALREHPGATATELAVHSGIGYSTTARLLNNLENDGLARRRQGPKRRARNGVPANHWWPVEIDCSDSSSATAGQTSDRASDSTQSPRDKGEPWT